MKDAKRRVRNTAIFILLFVVVALGFALGFVINSERQGNTSSEDSSYERYDVSGYAHSVIKPHLETNAGRTVSEEIFDKEQAEWHEARKAHLLEMYPISEEGRNLLESVSILKLPYAPIVSSNGRESYGHAICRYKLAVTSSVHPTQTLHEFSHVAFCHLVGKEDEARLDAARNRLREDLLEEINNPDPNFMGIALCAHQRLSRDVFEKAKEDIEKDPEHYLISIIEFAGGNLNLIPPSLRKYTPWLAPGKAQSWDEVREAYISLDKNSREIYDAMRLKDPFYCTNSSNIMEDGFADISAHPLFRDDVRVFREAQAELVGDILNNSLWKREFRELKLRDVLFLYPDLFELILEHDHYREYKLAYEKLEQVSILERERAPFIYNPEYILENPEKWLREISEIQGLRGKYWIYDYKAILNDEFYEFAKQKFPEFFASEYWFDCQSNSSVSSRACGKAVRVKNDLKSFLAGREFGMCDPICPNKKVEENRKVLSEFAAYLLGDSDTTTTHYLKESVLGYYTHGEKLYAVFTVEIVYYDGKRDKVVFVTVHDRETGELHDVKFSKIKSD